MSASGHYFQPPVSEWVVRKGFGNWHNRCGHLSYKPTCMFRNYLKTAWRTALHAKTYSAITIIGLTIGLCASMLMLTIVLDDLSYDKQWTNGAELYRILSVNKRGVGIFDRNTSSFAGLGPSLKTAFPEVLTTGQLDNDHDRFRFGNMDPNGVSVSLLRADTSIFDMLDISVMDGDAKHYVGGVSNIILTAGFCKKFFPGLSPLGRTIYRVPSFDNKPQPYLVTAIIKDLPANSVFRAEAIVIDKPRTEQLSKAQGGTLINNNYILVRKGTDMSRLSAKINKWYAGYVNAKHPLLYEFQPLKNVYLESDFANGQQVKSDITRIYIFSGVALLILVLACVNFVTLSTARAIKRLPETGVRKVLGAGREQLVYQFLTESFLFFGIATIGATLLYIQALPLVEKYLGHQLAVTFTSRSPLFALAYLSVFMISLLVGFYPAWNISGFQPADTLKGRLLSTNLSSQNVVRKCLVVVQFSLSILVLIALMVVQQQVHFMENKDLGYEKHNLLNIGMIGWDNKAKGFKNELLHIPGVQSASVTSWTPYGGLHMTTDINDPFKSGNTLTVGFISGDIDLAKTMGFHLLNGRSFDPSFAMDALNQDSLMGLDMKAYTEGAGHQSSLITAYTARVLGIKNLNTPINQALTSPIGIIEDFNNESLRSPLKPIIIVAEEDPQYGGMLIRVAPGTERSVSMAVSRLWRSFFPEKLLDMQSVDDMLDKQYREENRLQQLFSFFSFLSMFLAALGILGLIVQATEQRRKEIGIRKVLGATVASIVQLFTADFVKLVFIALLIASPLAWWLMNKWLTDFAFRIHISPWVFAIAGSASLAMAVITISFQTIKAAMSNPVKSLRTE